MNYIIHGTSCQEIAINHTRVSDPQQIILADVIFMTTWLKHRPDYHDISTSRIISFQYSRCCVGLKNYECAFLFYEVWMHTASCIKSPSRETWPWASYHIRKNADCGLRMRRECREGFPPPPTSKETAGWRSRHASRHVRHARAVMHVRIAYPQWRGKRSRNSRRIHTRNFTYLARGSCHAYKPTFLNDRSWILLHCTNRASEAWHHGIVIQTLSFLYCKMNFHD